LKDSLAKQGIETEDTAREPAKTQAPKKRPDGTGGATAEEATPHKIPGTGHSFASWAAKYCDLIGTSKTVEDAYKWIDLNAEPLGRLGKATAPEAGEASRKCSTAAKRVIDTLKAEAPTLAGSDMGDYEGEDSGDMFDGEAPQWPTDPEAQLKHIDRLLGQSTADTIEAIWDDMIAEHYDQMFPPDQTEAMAIYRKHEARVAP